MRSVKQVAYVIVKKLGYLIKWPDSEFENRRIAAGFSRRSRPHKFPNVCGAIDDTLINISTPKTTGGAYVSLYGNKALNILGHSKT